MGRNRSNSPAAPAPEQEAAQDPVAEVAAAAEEAVPAADEAPDSHGPHEAFSDEALEHAGPEDASAEGEDVAAACAELGIKADKEGKAEVELLVCLSGAEVKNPGDRHECDAAEAVRLVRAGFAKPIA